MVMVVSLVMVVLVVPTVVIVKCRVRVVQLVCQLDVYVVQVLVCSACVLYVPNAYFFEWASFVS